MQSSYRRIHSSILPTLVLSIGLVILGLLAINYIVDSWWPFDVERLDLVRATALDRLDSASLMESANTEIILAFLSAALVTSTGLSLPIIYLLNRRFSQRPVPFLVILRQSMWFGFWFCFCLWLQLNRMLGLAVALLVALVLVLFEFLIQLRTRTKNAEE